MVNYECVRCNYKTEHKAKMRLHISKKIPCPPEKKDVNVLDYEDEILNKDESKKTLLEKIKKLEERNTALETEVLQLKSQVNTKVANVNSNVGAQINGDNTHNIIFNFNLTAYNDPNLEGAEKYYLNAVKKAFLSIPTIIENVHFNKEFPENHNICITNFRTKLAKVFNGKEWKTMKEDILIDELIKTYEGLLEEWAEDHPERMKYIERYKEIKERDGESKVMKDVKDEVKRLIYDKRDMVKIKN